MTGQEREALAPWKVTQKALRAARRKHFNEHPPGSQSPGEEFTAGYRAALAAREDTERPDLRGQLEAAGLTDSEVDAVLVRDTERPERHCPHCGKLMLVPGRNYEIDPAAVCRCGGRAEPPKNQLQAIVDFLDSWRYCPVASVPHAARQCLEDAASQLLTALAAAREDTERPLEKALQAALDGAQSLLEMEDRPHPGEGEVSDAETIAETDKWDDEYGDKLTVYEACLGQLDRVRDTEQEHER